MAPSKRSLALAAISKHSKRSLSSATLRTSLSSLSSAAVARRKRPILSYEAFVWIIYLTFTLLAIADRFSWNVWPRQTFSIGKGSAGSDRMIGFKPGPWSVVVYDVLARISGRFAICCFNLLLITRLRFLEVILSTSWVGKHLLDCSIIVEANIRLHSWNAIGLAALTLLHVYSILLPCVTHRWSAKVVPGTFEYPLSERTPPGFKDADPNTQAMSLQADDVFRMVEMTLLLLVLLPLSMRWLATRRHVGVHVHRFISVIYFVDIVRRHSHPHSWVLNTPVFVVWLLDKVWSTFWRRFKPPQVHRIKLGADYMVLLWENDKVKNTTTTVGPDYFLRLNDSSILESAHVFTTFGNRGCLPDCEDIPENWTVAAVIRVFRNRRVPRLGARDAFSHTMRMYDEPGGGGPGGGSPPLTNLTTWGPYPGEMSDRVSDALTGTYGNQVALIAAGSGVNFIIDACQFLNAATCDLTVFFTTRDVALYEWTRRVLSKLIHPDHICINKVVLALTKGGGGEGKKEVDQDCEEGGGTDFGFKETSITFTCTAERIDFQAELPFGGVVFCQGSQGLKDIVRSACRERGSRFYGGLGGKL